MSNPAADTLPLKQPRRLPKYLTIREQERVLKVLAQDSSLTARRDLALVATALFCGLRCEELATLRVEHVNLEDHVLRVLGKGSKERECVIIPRLRAILTDYLEHVRPAMLARAIQGNVYRRADTHVWRGAYKFDGKRYDFSTETRDEAEARRVLAERVAEACIRHTSPFMFVRGSRNGQWVRRKSGLPLLTRHIFALIRRRLTPILGRPVAPHMLRHSFASRLRENGADLVLIQEALGHANLTTTTIYAHLSSKKRKADVARYLEGGA